MVWLVEAEVALFATVTEMLEISPARATGGGPPSIEINNENATDQLVASRTNLKASTPLHHCVFIFSDCRSVRQPKVFPKWSGWPASNGLS